MVLNEKKFMRGNLGEIFRMCFQGRYMMLMMVRMCIGFLRGHACDTHALMQSIFAIYCGVVYNDLFAQGCNFFGSVYTFPTAPNTTAIRNSPTAVYPFGVDPIWHVAGNDLLFFNSLKMKLSVILGVTQVLFSPVCPLAYPSSF